MKKLTRTLFLSIVLLLIGFTYSNAQKRVGGSFAYGTEVEEFGINVNAELFIVDKIAITPGFTFFFTEENFTFWTLNADGHFYIMEASSGFYALGGINIAHSEVDLSVFGLGDVTDTEFGLNLGGGYSFDLAGPIVPFAEVKYVISDFDQLVLSAGVRFGL